MNLFTYGSLMIPSVMAAVTGKRFKVTKACLKEYARFKVKGESYPGIVYQPGAATDGVVHCDVDDLSLKLLDDFEGEMYKRIPVPVEVIQSGVLIAAKPIFAPEHLQLLSSEPWDFEEFKKEHLQEFLRNYKGFSLLPKHVVTCTVRVLGRKELAWLRHSVVLMKKNQESAAGDYFHAWNQHLEATAFMIGLLLLFQPLPFLLLTLIVSWRGHSFPTDPGNA